MTHSQRRDVLKAAGTVAVIGGLAGCAEDEEPLEDEEGEAPTEEQEEPQEEPEDDVGAFRVAHASPDAPNVDVYFDDQAVIEDLEFREVSPYEEVEPDSYQVQVTAADDPDAVVFDEEVEVEGGVTNTAVAFGEAAGGPENEFTVEILEDDISEPGEDTSRVRFFHASPDAEEVDIVVAEAPEEIEEDDEEAEDEELPENDQPQPPEGETEETQQEDEPPEDEDEEMPDDEPEEDEEDEPAEEPQVGEPLFEGVGFGDDDTQEIPAGDYTLEVVPAEEDPEEEDEDEEMPDEEPEEDEDEPTETQQEDEDEAEDEAEDEPPEDEDEEMPDDEPEEDEDEPAEEPVDEFELSTESQTVYSAFAVGYVEPPEEGDEDEEDEEENDDGLLQDGENEEFEVVIVEDASEGERADGGTNGNGLLTLQH